MATSDPVPRGRAASSRARRAARRGATAAGSAALLCACVAPWATPPASTGAPEGAAPAARHETVGPRGPAVASAHASEHATPDVSGVKPAPGGAPVEAGGALADPTAAPAAPYPHDDVRRLALAQRLAGEAGWNLYESASWFLATPVADPLLVEGTKQRLEGVRSRLHAELPPRRGEAHRAKALVRIHPSRAEFEAAGGQRGTSGFWNGPERTLVVYDAGAERAETTWPALQHVAVHAFLDDELGLANVPPWFLYGVAARYESLVHRELRTGGSSLIAPPPEAEQARLASALEDGPPMPLGELLRFDRDAFLGANAYRSGGFRNLVLAHAFVRFLEAEDAGTSAELDACRAGFLAAVFGALQDGADVAAAVARARGVVPAAELDAAWRTWLEAEVGGPLPPPR